MLMPKYWISAKEWVCPRISWKHAGKTFLAPALELGGKDGAYVHEDADIKYAAESLVDGAMFNSGQKLSKCTFAVVDLFYEVTT